MAKWVKLADWLQETYGDDPPHRNTIRNWIKADKIQPPPEKHGRGYYFRPEARYAEMNSKRLVERINRK